MGFRSRTKIAVADPDADQFRIKFPQNSQASPKAAVRIEMRTVVIFRETVPQLLSRCWARPLLVGICPHPQWRTECRLNCVLRQTNMSETQTAPAEIQLIPFTVDAAKFRAMPVILLVEDDALVREVAADILEYEGFRVLKARNALEAKMAFHRYTEIVRLLITDVVLPGQNGRDLANELRTACPTLRVVFVSGFPENAVTRQGLIDGEMLYLPKPFSAESLVRTAKQALAVRAQEVAI